MFNKEVSEKKVLAPISKLILGFRSHYLVIVFESPYYKRMLKSLSKGVQTKQTSDLIICTLISEN